MKVPISPSGWWWLSFFDGDTLLGACIVEGATIIDAVRRASALDCNLGGAVLGNGFSVEAEAFIDARWRNRALTPDECDEFIKRSSGEGAVLH